MSSTLIRTATDRTYAEWLRRYGELPDPSRLIDGGLRTEIGIKAVKSTNPGYCYKCAGWTAIRDNRGIRFLTAPTVKP